MRQLCVLLWAASMAAASAWASEIRDTKFGYSVSPPDFSSPAPGVVFIRVNVLAPPEAGFAPNMGVMIQEITFTRDQFVARSKEQFDAAGMKLRSSRNRTVSGQPAVLFDYEGQVGGRTLRFLQLAVILPERILILTYTATTSAFPGLEAQFRRSLDTFQLTPQ